MLEINAFRSDGLVECIYEKNDWPNDHDPGHDLTEAVKLGPFDWVQLTYEHLRVAPEGDFLGQIIDGDWYIEGHEHPFSDIVIGFEAVA